MTPAFIVLAIEEARVARAALEGRPAPRLLRPALGPLPAPLEGHERARSARRLFARVWRRVRRWRSGKVT